MPIYVYVAASAVALSVPLLVWALSSGRGGNVKVAANLAAATAGANLRQAVLARSAQERAVLPALRVVADRARRMTPIGWLEELERQLELAGRPAAWPLERVLAAKVLLGLAGLLGGLAVLPGGWFLTVVYTVVFYFIPDLLLRSRARERQRLIARELPDTLDQITISVEAGLAFENAMARAARSGSGPLAAELFRTLQEVQLGASRSNALRGLADRNDAPELRHFVVALLQAEQYGVPVVEVLRLQAEEMRIRRGQRAEERAMKVPVKIIFPLVFCILPVIFIVVLGPAAIGMAEIFQGM